LRLEKHAILDEVQHVPALFAAIKPIVDANRNAVRFILTRDLSHIGSLDALPKLLMLAASQTARLANLSEMASQFELSRPTIRSYLTLIERRFLVEFLPPWFSNRIKRRIKSPKLHFGDTGSKPIQVSEWPRSSTHPAPPNKKGLKDRPFLFGGEGEIRTHVPELPDHPISSRRRCDHFGTSPVNLSIAAV
jgi:predicted AAA+ superfamily ATPase